MMTNLNDVSDLLMAMTIRHAPDKEIYLVVEHARVILDTSENDIETIKKSAEEKNIAEMVKKYQTHTTVES